MVDILDVAPVAREVDTHRYGKLSVKGLSISGIVHLIKNHPELFKMFSENGEQNMTMDEIAILGEDVVAAFIAAGLGHPGNEQVVEKCRSMNPDDMWTVGEAILEESFPGGAANFFQRVMEAMKKANLIQISKDLSSEMQNLKSKSQEAEENKTP